MLMVVTVIFILKGKFPYLYFANRDFSKKREFISMAR